MRSLHGTAVLVNLLLVFQVNDDSLESLLAEDSEEVAGPRGRLGERLRALSLAGCNAVTARGVKILAAAVNGDVRSEVTVTDARSADGVPAGAIGAQNCTKGFSEQVLRTSLNDEMRGSTDGGHLTSLSLHGCAGVNDGAVKSLRRLGALEQLNISATHITAKGLRGLFAARTNGFLNSGRQTLIYNTSKAAALDMQSDKGRVLPVLRVVNARCLPGNARDLAAAIGSLRLDVALRTAASRTLHSNCGKWRVLGGEAPTTSADSKTMRTRGNGAAASAASDRFDDAAIAASATEMKPEVNTVPFNWSTMPRASGASVLAAWVGMRGLPGDVVATAVETLHPLARPRFVSSLLDPSQYPHGNDGQQQRPMHVLSAPPTLIVDEEGLVVGAAGHPLASPPRRWEQKGHVTAPVVPLPF